MICSMWFIAGNDLYYAIYFLVFILVSFVIFVICLDWISCCFSVFFVFCRVFRFWVSMYCFAVCSEDFVRRIVFFVRLIFIRLLFVMFLALRMLLVISFDLIIIFLIEDLSADNCLFIDLLLFWMKKDK